MNDCRAVMHWPFALDNTVCLIQSSGKHLLSSGSIAPKQEKEEEEKREKPYTIYYLTNIY